MVLLASVKVIMFSTVPLGLLSGVNAPGRVTPSSTVYKHQEEMTSPCTSTCSPEYVRASPCTRSRVWRIDLRLRAKQHSACCLREGASSRLKTRLCSWPPYSKHTLTPLRIMGESATADVERRKTRSRLRRDSNVQQNLQGFISLRHTFSSF